MLRWCQGSEYDQVRLRAGATHSLHCQYLAMNSPLNKSRREANKKTGRASDR